MPGPAVNRESLCYNLGMVPDLSFSRPASDLIRSRFSCRTFTRTEISPVKKREIDGLLAALSSAADGVRLSWIDKKQLRGEQVFTSGTYGMIKGNRWFVAGIIRRTRPDIWEDLGTRLEMAVLKLTEWDLNTCWIGGVFDRKRFGRYLKVAPDETIPAVIAVGIADARPSLRDRVVRWSARGNSRKNPGELFFSGDNRHPLADDDRPLFGDLLESVRLGPSASNKQPWRIVLCPPSFHFFLDRDRFYSRLIPQADLQRIDLGIARCHFHLAAREAGLAGAWLTDDPRLPGLPGTFEYLFSYRLQP